MGGASPNAALPILGMAVGWAEWSESHHEPSENGGTRSTRPTLLLSPYWNALGTAGRSRVRTKGSVRPAFEASSD